MTNAHKTAFTGGLHPWNHNSSSAGDHAEALLGGMKSVNTEEFLEGMTLTNVAHANPEEVR